MRWIYLSHCKNDHLAFLCRGVRWYLKKFMSLLICWYYFNHIFPNSVCTVFSACYVAVFTSKDKMYVQKMLWKIPGRSSLQLSQPGVYLFRFTDNPRHFKSSHYSRFICHVLRFSISYGNCKIWIHSSYKAQSGAMSDLDSHQTKWASWQRNCRNCADNIPFWGKIIRHDSEAERFISQRHLLIETCSKLTYALLFMYLTLRMRSAHKKEALLTLPVFAASKRNDQQENKKNFRGIDKLANDQAISLFQYASMSSSAF